jgi:REP element-mobilizing transposase RayT
MPYREDVFAKDNYYHIYNRGVNKGQIFFNPGNYEYCIRLMQRVYQKYGASIIAYCLMPNHYHFLLKQKGDTPLSRFINVLFNAYVQAVNRQQERIGTLFEKRFRHVCIKKEEYLIHLCRYIHLNPVKAQLVADPEKWLYSDYHEWIGEKGAGMLDTVFIRERFLNPHEYRSFVNNYRNEYIAQEFIPKYILD